MKNMIPATNGKSIYIPPQGDWRLRRFDEASTLDETVLSKSFSPCASITLPRPLAEEEAVVIGFLACFGASAIRLEGRVGFWHAFCTNTTPNFCILPQLRPISDRFGSERIQLINPVFYLFCHVGVSFLCILLLWRKQTRARRGEGRPTVAPNILH